MKNKVWNKTVISTEEQNVGIYRFRVSIPGGSVTCDPIDLKDIYKIQWSWPAYGLQKAWVDFEPPAKKEEEE